VEQAQRTENQLKKLKYHNLLEHIDLTEGFQHLKRAYKKDGERLFTRACSDRTRGNSFKLKESRVTLDIRKKFVSVRVVRPWPRLPREAVAAPSVAGFKPRLDGAGSTLGWWKGSLLTAEGLDYMVFEGPFQCKPFYDSITVLYNMKQSQKNF